MKDHNCLFCKIIEGEIPSYKIYEDSNHLAVLDIFPAVKGQSLTMPKKHHSSYIFDMPARDYMNFMKFTREVALTIDPRLGAIRSCMVMEGMEVDHAHIKLYPIYNVVTRVAKGTIDLNEYKGFISTLHGKMASEAELLEVYQKITGTKK